MIEVAVSVGTVMLCFGGLWRVAVRHDWWDRPEYEHQTAHVSVPGLVDYEVHPTPGGIT